MASRIEVLKDRLREDLPPNQEPQKNEKAPPGRKEVKPEKLSQKSEDKTPNYPKIPEKPNPLAVAVLDKMEERPDLSENSELGFLERFSHNSICNSIISPELASFFGAGVSEAELILFIDKIILPGQGQTRSGVFKAMMIRLGISEVKFLRTAQEFLLELTENKSLTEMKRTANQTKAQFIENLNTYLHSHIENAANIQLIYQKITKCQQYQKIINTEISAIKDLEPHLEGENLQKVMGQDLIQSAPNIDQERINELIQNNPELASRSQEFGLSSGEFLFLLQDTESLDHPAQTNLMIEFLTALRNLITFHPELEQRFNPILVELATTIVRHPWVMNILIKVNHHQAFFEYLSQNFTRIKTTDHSQTLIPRTELFQQQIELSDLERKNLKESNFPKAVQSFAERTVLTQIEVQVLIQLLASHGDKSEIRNVLQFLDEIAKNDGINIAIFQKYPGYMTILLQKASIPNSKEELILRKLINNRAYTAFQETLKQEQRYQEHLIMKHQEVIAAVERIKTFINQIHDEGQELRNGLSVNMTPFEYQDNAFSGGLTYLAKMGAFMLRRTTELSAVLAGTVALSVFVSPYLVVSPILYAFYIANKAQRFKADNHIQAMAAADKSIKTEIENYLPGINNYVKNRNTEFQDKDPHFNNSNSNKLLESIAIINTITNKVLNRRQNEDDTPSIRIWTTFDDLTHAVTRFVKRYLLNQKESLKHLDKTDLDIFGFQGDYNKSFSNLFDFCDQVIDQLKAEMKVLEKSIFDLQSQINTRDQQLHDGFCLKNFQ
jgi:hypothetical protein